MESDRRLYVTADGARVVEEGDPDGAFLLVGAGSEIEPDVAEKHKLRISKGKVRFPAPEPKAAKPKAAKKAKAKKAKAKKADTEKAKAERAAADDERDAAKAKRDAANEDTEEAEPEADSQGADDSATE